jgi:hypothetical protein
MLIAPFCYKNPESRKQFKGLKNWALEPRGKHSYCQQAQR